MRPQDNPFLRERAESKRVNREIWRNSTWSERIRALALDAFILFPIMTVAIILGWTYLLLDRLGLSKPPPPPPPHTSPTSCSPQEKSTPTAKRNIGDPIAAPCA